MEPENDKISLRDKLLSYKMFLENVHKPQTRHKFEVRKFIRENGGIVEADELLDFMREKYGYTNEILTNMLLEMEEQDVIMAVFVENEHDLRYINYKEKYFD